MGQPGGRCGGHGAVSYTHLDVYKRQLQRVPGAQAEQIRLNLEMDDGRMVYEGKIIHQEREYDFEIDADTGEIISWEEESVFD